MGTAVFFRDDDVGELTPELRTIVELLIAERIPCNYLVIPRFVTLECADYMRRRRREHPDLVVLNQHGYLHEQIIRGTHDYSEFAGGRPYAEQVAAIAEGRRILEQLLGEDFSADVFTPPCHKYDGNTLRAIRACGFSVFSAGVRADLPARAYYEMGRALGRITLLGQRVSYHGARDPSNGLVDLSTAINVDEDFDRQGNRITKSAADLEAEWHRAREIYPAVGVLLHHQQYGTTEKVETLRALIQTIKRAPDVSFRTIESLAQDLGADLRSRTPQRAAAAPA